MKIYFKNGYANKNFAPKGKFDNINRRTGKWVDYSFETITTFTQDDVKEMVNDERSVLFIQSKGLYHVGKKTGVWQFYGIVEKSLKKIHLADITFVRGVREGPVVYYFTSGQVASKGNFSKDKKNGPATTYYKSGKLSGESIFLNDYFNGDILSYYSTGELRTKALYVNGYAEGVHFSYYKNGVVNKKWIFSNGKQEGLTQIFYPNGAIQEEDFYVNDEVTDYKYYYQSGQLWVHREYKNEVIYNIYELNDPNGKPMDFGTLKDGNGTILFYTEQGKVYLKRTLENGIVIKEEEFAEFE